MTPASARDSLQALRLPTSNRAEGYSAPSAASIYALAEPDFSEPLPRPTRTGVVWDEDAWTEIDPKTGAVLATGTVAPHPEREELRP